MMNKAGEGLSRTIDGSGRAHSSFTKAASDIPNTLSVEYIVSDDSPRVPFSSRSKLFTHDDGGLRIVNPKDEKVNRFNRGFMSVMPPPCVGPPTKDVKANNKGFMGVRPPPCVGPPTKDVKANNNKGFMGMRPPCVGPTQRDEKANHNKGFMSVRPPCVGPAQRDEKANHNKGFMSVRPPCVGPSTKDAKVNHDKGFMSVRPPCVGPTQRDEKANHNKGFMSVRPPCVGPTAKDEKVNHNKGFISVRPPRMGPTQRDEKAKHNKGFKSVRPPCVGPAGRDQSGVRAAGNELEKFPKYPSERKDNVNVAKKFDRTTFARSDSSSSRVSFSSGSKSLTHDGGLRIVNSNKGCMSVRPYVGPAGKNQPGVTKHGSVVRGAGNVLEKFPSGNVKVANKFDPTTSSRRDSKAINGPDRKYDVMKFNPITFNQRDSKPVNGLETKGDAVKKIKTMNFSQRDSKSSAARKNLDAVTVPQRYSNSPNGSNKRKYGAISIRELVSDKKPRMPPRHPIKKETSCIAKKEFKGPKIENKAPKIEDKFKIPNFKEFSFLKSTPGGFPMKVAREDTSGPSRTSPLIRPKEEPVEDEDVVEVKPTPVGVQKQRSPIIQNASNGKFVSASQFSTVNPPLVGASQISTLPTPIKLAGDLQSPSLNTHINQMGAGCSRINQVKLEDDVEVKPTPFGVQKQSHAVSYGKLVGASQISKVKAPVNPVGASQSLTLVTPIDLVRALQTSLINTHINQMGAGCSSIRQFKLEDALEDLSQPKTEATIPDGLLAVPLMKHQRIALSWMVNQETKCAFCCGGILADDQGLGKTISTIALILKERSPSSKSPKPNEAQQNDLVILNSDKDRLPAGTLIVCPTSVLRQWSQELVNKVTPEADLSVLVYHGANRTKDPVELAKYDVVVTTYALVGQEVPMEPAVNEKDDPDGNPFNMFKKKGFQSRKNGDKIIPGPLSQVGWFRVVLDEAQCIKNHRTMTARACWGLHTKHSWCLSGTPIQNTIEDLYSYFRFLKYDPYANFRMFCSEIKSQIIYNEKNGYERLRAVLKTCLLRRTKSTFIDGEPIIILPPKSIELQKIEFSKEERDFYKRLETDSRAQFQEYAAAGTVKQNYAYILVMLLRLRQACGHPYLVDKSKYTSQSMSSITTAKKLPREKQVSLLDCLEASSSICGICNDSPEDAVVTVCGHVYCHQCICELMIGDDTECPADSCETNLVMARVFSKDTLLAATSNDESVGNNRNEVVLHSRSSTCPLTSSKIKATLKLLLSITKPQKKEETTSETSDFVGGKAIVFSQWTKMLDVLEDCLKEYSIGYRRLDGTMSVSVRDRAVKDFNTLPQVSVMIMSLKAASLGLNMVAANNVILLDLWWNPTTEDQAIDRAHRIGQTRPVSVYRLTVEETVEDRILELQQRKRAIVASAFGEEGTGVGKQTHLSVKELAFLFGA